MYTIKLDDADLNVLSSALAEMPYRMVAGLIAKISSQVAAASKGPASEESRMNRKADEAGMSNG